MWFLDGCDGKDDDGDDDDFDDFDDDEEEGGGGGGVVTQIYKFSGQLFLVGSSGFNNV